MVRTKTWGWRGVKLGFKIRDNDATPRLHGVIVCIWIANKETGRLLFRRVLFPRHRELLVSLPPWLTLGSMLVAEARSKGSNWL